MAIVVTAESGRTFTPAPAGLHQAVCVDVVDMGILEVTYSGKTKKQHKLRVVWQIDEPMEDGRRFIVQKRYTASLNEKATLRKDLESWRGRAFTDEELSGFDVEKVVGVNAQVNVQHSTNGQYANVVSVVPLGKGMQKISPDGYVRVKDRTPDTVADGLPDEPLTVDDIPF